MFSKFIFIIFTLSFTFTNSKSPLTQSQREIFISRTSHSRTTLITSNFSPQNIDNFMFGAVPFITNPNSNSNSTSNKNSTDSNSTLNKNSTDSSSKINSNANLPTNFTDPKFYDETKINMTVYEDTLLMEAWWWCIFALVMVTISLLFWCLRPCLGGVKGGIGICRPRLFDIEIGEGYGYIQIKIFQIVAIVAFIIVLFSLILTQMWNGSIRAHVMAVDRSSETVLKTFQRDLRLINNSFSYMNIDETLQTNYSTQFFGYLNQMKDLERSIESNSGKFGDYFVKYNRSREVMMLFGIYASAIMLILYLFSACTFHHQMSSGLAIFGWLLGAILMISSILTYSQTILVADACLLGDQILDANNFEELSVVKWMYPINQQSSISMQMLLQNEMYPQTIEDLQKFLKKNCGVYMVCDEKIMRLIDDLKNAFSSTENMTLFENIPFINKQMNNNQTELYSSIQCTQYCNEEIKKLSKQYNQYFEIIKYLQYLITGPIDDIRHGKSFETYLYNLMEYLCKDDTFSILCYVMMAIMSLSAVLVWLMSFLAMVSGKRFNQDNTRIIMTTKEASFRGGIHKYETANLSYFGGLLVERRRKFANSQK